MSEYKGSGFKSSGFKGCRKQWKSKQWQKLFEEDHPFTTLRRAAHGVVDEVFRELPIERMTSWTERFAGFAPRVDVAENDSALLIVVELPGLQESDVELSLTEDALTLRGSKADSLAEGTTKHNEERAFGEFERTVTLPCEILEEGVDASFDRGVLTVTIPKKSGVGARGKKIVIRSADGEESTGAP